MECSHFYIQLSFYLCKGFSPQTHGFNSLLGWHACCQILCVQLPWFHVWGQQSHKRLMRFMLLAS
jgi:hypothetical protein